MSRHRAVPARRRQRARPRYGRIAVLGASVAVTAVAMLGGFGVLPSVANDPAENKQDVVAKDTSPKAQLAANDQPQGVVDAGPTPEPEPAPSQEQQAEPSEAAADPTAPAADAALPADSGEGRRVVFSETDQQVWLVNDDESVARTYPVSGSVYDNLDPGTYSVYSRSENATGIDGSGMQWFVRFTEGDNGGAIGFHDIPVAGGVPVQTEAQLGTPLSHGCVRQRTEDALALWDFAPIGTEVVVV